MLTLLHTAEVHVARFAALRDRLAPGAELAQVVRADWLARARAEGVEAVADEVTAVIRAAKGPVICTCTTLGPVAEAAGASRVDRPMMQRAARLGGPVLLVYTLASTAEASATLLGEYAPDIRTLDLSPLWPLFEAGRGADFAAAIAEGVRAELTRQPAVVVVLAQVSMSDAAPLLAGRGVPVLSAPETALRAGLGL
ncbi:hypothetical protein ACX9MO_07015 [Pseudooceanicola sp. 502str34]